MVVVVAVAIHEWLQELTRVGVVFVARFSDVPHLTFIPEPFCETWRFEANVFVFIYLLIYSFICCYLFAYLLYVAFISEGSYFLVASGTHRYLARWSTRPGVSFKGDRRIVHGCASDNFYMTTIQRYGKIWTWFRLLACSNNVRPMSMFCKAQVGRASEIKRCPLVHPIPSVQLMSIILRLKLKRWFSKLLKDRPRHRYTDTVVKCENLDRRLSIGRHRFLSRQRPKRKDEGRFKTDASGSERTRWFQARIGSEVGFRSTAKAAELRRWMIAPKKAS